VWARLALPVLVRRTALAARLPNEMAQALRPARGRGIAGRPGEVRDATGRACSRDLRTLPRSSPIRKARWRQLHAAVYPSATSGPRYPTMQSAKPSIGRPRASIANAVASSASSTWKRFACIPARYELACALQSEFRCDRLRQAQHRQKRCRDDPLGPTSLPRKRRRCHEQASPFANFRFNNGRLAALPGGGSARARDHREGGPTGRDEPAARC
jgi:hypothetical protein